MTYLFRHLGSHRCYYSDIVPVKDPQYIVADSVDVVVEPLAQELPEKDQEVDEEVQNAENGFHI